MSLDRLIGVWKLCSVRFEVPEAGECFDLLGPRPSGRLILTSSGHMMALLTAAERPAPIEPQASASLFAAMMAYSGAYRLEGDDRFITTCDLSWHPAWLATEQVRFFKLAGDQLSIRTGLQSHPVIPGKMGHGMIEWARET